MGLKQKNKLNMSKWVRLDITSFTKTTNREKILKILKGAKVECCEITDPYMNTDKTKTAFQLSSSELILKPRLLTTQGHGLLRRTMQPSLLEDHSSKQHLAARTLTKIFYLRIQPDPKFPTMLF